MTGRHFLYAICIFVFGSQTLAAENYEITSPNGKLKIKIQVDNGTKYEVWQEEMQLISLSSIALNLEDGRIIGNDAVGSTERNEVRRIVPVVVGKNKTLNDYYNELIIHYQEPYDLIVKAYDEGVAYRFVTNIAENIIINSEEAVFNFPVAPKVYFPFSGTDMKNFGYYYITYNSIQDIPSDKFSVSPILFEYPNTTVKVAVTESDTYDYPGLYVERNGENSMRGMFAKCLIKNEDGSEGRLNYIANTTGTRSFPWRVIIVSDDDKSLLNNELVYLLAEPNQVEDTSWLTAGKSAWEWWHKGMLTADGKADPANGIPANGQENNNANWNYEFYKYYVDFAAENNIQYMTLDAGGNLGGDLRRLCNYAKGKGVKIIIWTWATHTHENLGWIQQMKNTGVSGVKIDFFDRNDQEVMTWGRTFAEELAKNQMIGIFHGCPIPTGLNRAYPNILNFEAVNGNEVNFWDRTCTPDYHLLLPFIRSLAGPIEFTPGSMRNKTERQFQQIDQYNVVPSSMGTRAHELSMYVIFDQWLGFLCDAPTEYRKYPEILDFLSTVPTVWDKTLPLNSRLGEYILTAKQTGNNWYVGGMTNSTARDMEVDFSFLAPGQSYRAYIIKDGDNANTYPTRTAVETPTVTSETKLTISMAKGGGFVIRLTADDTSVTPEAAKPNASVSLDKDAQILYVYAVEPILSLSIYNSLGQLVLKKTDITAGQPLALSSLTRGSYVVKIETERGVRTLKVMY